MEQNEGEEGLIKFNSLYAKHEKTFLHLIRTCHPANIPDELPGKGSNEAHATQEAKQALTALGLDINYLVFTVKFRKQLLMTLIFNTHAKKIIFTFMQYVYAQINVAVTFLTFYELS